MSTNWDSFQKNRSIDESIISNPWENTANGGNNNQANNIANLVAPNPISPILSHQSHHSQLLQQHDDVASIISSLNGTHQNFLSNQSSFLNPYKKQQQAQMQYDDSAIMSDSGSDALRDAISAISAPVANQPINNARFGSSIFGSASVAGVSGLKNATNTNSSFLDKFSAVAEKTRELESSYRIGSRRSSMFNNEPKSPQQLFREPRKQSFSEKLESYMSAKNSPNTSRHLSFSSDIPPSDHASAIMNNPNQNHPSNSDTQWNPAAATVFHPSFPQPSMHELSFMQQQSMMMTPFPSMPMNGPQSSNQQHSNQNQQQPIFFSPQMFPPFMQSGIPPQMMANGGGGDNTSTEMKPSDTTRSEYGSATDETYEDNNDAPSNDDTANSKLNSNENGNNKNGDMFPIGLNRPISPYVMTPFNPYNMFGSGAMISSPGSPINSPPMIIPPHVMGMIPNVSRDGNNNSNNRRNNRSNSPSNKNSRSPRSSGGKNNRNQYRNGNTKFKPKHIVRSPLLEEFINNQEEKQYTLEDIIPNGYEFAKDQYGSRFIQQQLAIVSDDVKEMFFKEIRNDSMDLIVDVFGNYIIQKYFEHGTSVQKKVLFENMRGSFNKLSLHMYGCRVIQRCLEGIELADQLEIMEELKPNILNLVKDQNGNHVIQKAIEQIPIEQIPFILDSLKYQIYHLSMHPYGCRVIQRLLECSNIEDQEFILNELKGFIYYLVQDQFGNYVIQHVIEKGEKKDTDIILNVILDNLIELSKHKFASNAVEKCIINLPTESKIKMYEAMLKDNSSLDDELNEQSTLMLMMKDPFANYVVQKMVELIDDDRKKLLVLKIRQYLKMIQKNGRGKHLASIEKLNHICSSFE